jgi:hypothetical protein
VPAGKKNTRGVSRRFYLATLLTLPAAGVILLARSDRGAAPSVTASPAPAAHDARPRSSAKLAPRAESGAREAKSAPSALEAERAVAPNDIAAALRRADVASARELAVRGEDPEQLQGVGVRDALLAVAADPTATPAGRAVALDLIRRAPGVDEASIAKIQAIVASTALDADTRTRAIDLLHQLTVNRPDLERPIQAALVDAATHAPDDEARALALETLSTKDAPETDVARVTGWLSDPNPHVRTGAARALATSSLRDRGAVVQGLERALASESDSETASVLIEAALRAGRGSADSLLSRMERAEVVRANAALARQITDYRGSLGAGETDPLRILAEHEAREGALVRSSTKGS